MVVNQNMRWLSTGGVYDENFKKLSLKASIAIIMKDSENTECW